jgi:hypothetical protein
MDDYKLAGYLIAHGVLLALLVEHAKKVDAAFIASARKQFNTYLGTRVGKDSPLDNTILVEARAFFQEILEAVETPGPLEIDMPSAPKQTIRRKFLNWLERG